jgi:hypothetical protein
MALVLCMNLRYLAWLDPPNLVILEDTLASVASGCEVVEFARVCYGERRNPLSWRMASFKTCPQRPPR